MSAQDDGLRESRINFRQTHHEFQQLGSGEYGIACLAAKKNANDQQAQISGLRTLLPSQHVNSTRLIVVKYYKENDDPEESGDLSNEITIMKTFGKKYHGVVPLLDSYIDDDVQWMTMPLISGGTLEELIDTSVTKVPRAFVWHVVHSIIGPLLFMYFGITSVDASGNTESEPRWAPVTHGGDVHSANILIGPPPPAAYRHSNFPLVVLADFGKGVTHSSLDAAFLDAAKDDVLSFTRVFREFYENDGGAQCDEAEAWLAKCENLDTDDYDFNVSTEEFLLGLLKTAAKERRKGDQNMPQAVLNEIASVPRLIDAPVIEEE
ncbi:hypothetical protein LTS10_010449 [Elasticomyces elasticus]|nr:hypothetical protein LTS10_010449 [Elasticomyces elasticus]